MAVGNIDNRLTIDEYKHVIKDCNALASDTSSIPHKLMHVLHALSMAVKANDAEQFGKRAKFEQALKNTTFITAYKQYMHGSMQHYLAEAVMHVIIANIELGVHNEQAYLIADKMLLAWPTEQRDFTENAWQLNKAIIGGPVFKDAMFVKSLNIIRFIELWADILQFNLWFYVRNIIQYNLLLLKPANTAK